MSFFTCELRCHILDRQDQLKSCKEHRKYLETKRQQLEAALATALAEYEAHIQRTALREKFIKLVESTLSERWIDRPDLLEKEWFAQEEA